MGFVTQIRPATSSYIAPSNIGIVSNIQKATGFTGGGTRDSGTTAAGSTPPSVNAVKSYLINSWGVSGSQASIIVSRMQAQSFPMTTDGASQYMDRYHSGGSGGGGDTTTVIPDVDTYVNAATGQPTQDQNTGFLETDEQASFWDRNKKIIIPAGILLVVVAGRAIYIRTQK